MIATENGWVRYGNADKFGASIVPVLYGILSVRNFFQTFLVIKNRFHQSE
jgi:hypothetical protein